MNGTNVHVLFSGKQTNDHYDALLPFEGQEKLSISEEVCFYRHNRCIATLLRAQFHSIKFSTLILMEPIFPEWFKLLSLVIYDEVYC